MRKAAETVWNRLKPFFDEIMGSEDENILIVSHGDLLSVFNTMFLGLNIEAMNTSEIYGRSGGVSHMRKIMMEKGSLRG